MERKKENSCIFEVSIPKQMRMIDMHAHLSCLEKYPMADFSGREWELAAAEGAEELNFRRQAGIVTCFSAGTPWEWEAMQQFGEREEILISFGIHPWYADRYRMEDCREYFDHCDFIGEIGMDSVWCEVPLSVQKRLLEKELQLAAELGKPVLLHTKGEEARIGEMIRDFPGKVCVHWYSGSETDLEKYLEKGCYFTLGPDTARLFRQKDQVRCRMLEDIPANRLFVETDGMDAAAWAEGADCLDLQELPQILERNMECAAVQKKVSPERQRWQMYANLREFLSVPHR
ncbi:MAG: TatD family hydrolase [Lachnospiraceae bacterium]|nr:TatD family hydrolase [Lachnospiraceae bacterium]